MFLIIDAIVKNQELLSSKEKLSQWLLDLSSILKLTPCLEPVMIELPVPNTGLVGLTGFLALKQSSITVHTYPELNLIYLDIFSCSAEWDTFQIWKFLDGSLQFSKLRKGLLFHRGVEAGGRVRFATPAYD